MAAKRKSKYLAFWLLVAALSGCAPTEDGVTLLLWHQMRPGDRAILAERIEVFEQQNPGVRVRPLYKETEELRSGLESAVLVGKGPDIVYGPSDPVGIYDEIGAVQDLSTWFDETARQEFDDRAFVTAPSSESDGGDSSEGNLGDRNLGGGTRGKDRLLFVGDRIGNHLALVYNRDQIPIPPTTTDEWIEIAKANTVDVNNDGRPERYGLVWNYTEPYFVVPFLTGYGAWVFDEELASQGKYAPTLDTTEAQAAYAFVASLRNEHRVLPPSADYESASALFLAGKAAMLIDGDWSWQRYLQAKGIDAAIAPLPIVSSTGLPMAPTVAPKGYCLSIAAKGERAELAGKLIRFLTNQATQQRFLEAQKVLPSRLALRDSPLLSSDPTMVASITQAERGRPMPTCVEIRAVWDAMRPPYQEIMAGSITPQEATPKMQKAVLSKIATLTSSIKPDASVGIVYAGGLLTLVACCIGLRRWWMALRADFPKNRLAYALSAPAMILIFLTVVFPLAYNVVLSFSNMSLQDFRTWEIVGLHNYTNVFFGEKSSEFWGVFFKTIFWTVINVSFHVVLGVFLAVLLNGPVRGKSIYRLLLIIPWAVPAYITALTWRGMFDYEFGAVNQLIRSINAWLPTWLDLPITNWLSEAGPAFTACIIANVWLGFPFMMVITLGGLQGIPQDLYEAARIDRASRWQQFWNITVPMLKPVLLPAIVLGTVWTFNNLNVVWLVSNGGEPADQTHILVSYVYKAVFNLYQYGYGAALSMVIFAMLLTFSALFLRQTKAVDGV